MIDPRNLPALRLLGALTAYTYRVDLLRGPRYIEHRRKLATALGQPRDYGVTVLRSQFYAILRIPEDKCAAERDRLFLEACKQLREE